jgi:hypothetical protein
LVQFVHASPNHLMKVQDGCLRLTSARELLL